MEENEDGSCIVRNSKSPAEDLRSNDPKVHMLKHTNPRHEDSEEEVGSQEESDPGENPEDPRPNEEGEDHADEEVSISDNPRSEETGEDQEEDETEEDEATETITIPQSEIQVMPAQGSPKEAAAHTMAPRESIIITDERGNPIQPEQPQNCLQWIDATDTQHTDTMESIARKMIYEGGISIIEGAMVMAANRFRPATVGCDLPPGALNCPRCNTRSGVPEEEEVDDVR